ncbi:MAG: hypothetical protein LKK26_06870 [Solobacterium sp.]|jgi:calcineurin-like phosphoesterase family protein|nr:hypothetical protein [Solobacterium sp.]
MDYFIADLHLGDEQIIHYENRPFADAEVMSRAFIENWNAAVKPGDTVWVLGDMSIRNYDCGKVLSELMGLKKLVLGNHDGWQKPEEWRKSGFEEVYDLPVVYQGFWILSHEPMYLNANMPYANIFGHVHGNPSVKDCSPQSFCVSAERIRYTPISFDSIRENVQACRGSCLLNH